MDLALEHRRIVANGVTQHYVVAGAGMPLVLLHGFPQTWTAWLPVIERLDSRFRVVAPSLRGLGGTPGPLDGYDTHSLAAAVRAVVEAECDDQAAIICGHDLGSHIAFAYALKYQSLVRTLILAGPPPPGTAAMDSLMTNPRTWHLAFHQNADVAHMLISGRERRYIDYFIKSRIYDTAAVGDADIDEYAHAYSAPGALRSALAMYQALPLDRELNLRALAEDGKLQVPVAVVGSELTSTQASLDDVAREIAIDCNTTLLDQCGHWIPQERPDFLAELLNNLLSDSKRD